MKFFLRSTTLLILSVLTFSVSNAQNTDLPNPNNNIKTMPVGSFVIAMDITNQPVASKTYFNLKTYGLIVTLQNAGVRLRWIIDSGKIHNAADFSVLAERAFPTFVAAGVTPKDFKAGPFVIFPTDTALAKIIITVYNNSVTNKVNVYRTTAAVDVNVRYDLLGNKPKAAILNDGTNGDKIHGSFMRAASIPATNYAVLDSAVNLYNGCYTFASEPHNDKTGAIITRTVDSIKDFVAKGGNFLAECHAIITYENFQSIQSSTGVTGGKANYGTDKGSVYEIGSNFVHQNSDLSFAQFDGAFDPNTGGSMQTWGRISNGVALNNFYSVITGSTAATDSVFGATVSKHVPGKGGLIFYLGNHDYNYGNNGTSTLESDINGVRMFMNAFLTPAAYGNCPLYVCNGGPECGPLPITLKQFKVRKINTQQVQIDWSTSTELNAKEFIVERSFDGISFVGIGKIDAQGFSSSEVAYSYKDLNPANGYNYYRLTEISGDGKMSYSEIATVYFSGRNTGLVIYPTPARESITVELNGLSVSNNLVSVLDLTGKTLINKLKVNSNTVKLNVSSFPAGTYILKAIGGNGVVLQNKFSVVKK